MRLRAAILLTVLAAAGCGSVPPAGHRPAGGWRVAYTGYGQVRAGRDGGYPAFDLVPARPRSATATHSALVLSAGRWHDFALAVRLRTTRQLRRPRPNDWEVGWLLWHYTDERHFYYLILKPNGFELGKEDPAYPGQQRFLVTGSEPRFPPGPWYDVRVLQRGDVISVRVNGRALVRYADTRHPYLAGLVGLYTEDAAVTYQVTGLQPAP